MNKDIAAYNQKQTEDFKVICELLATEIQRGLPKAESKIWHGGPVWFDDGNPLVGYWVRKGGVQLMFWSGMSFDEPGLQPVGNTERWKTAGMKYENPGEINTDDLQRWLKKSEQIQWDYKNVIKRRGVLERLR